jgi:hypothetical protein
MKDCCKYFLKDCCEYSRDGNWVVAADVSRSKKYDYYEAIFCPVCGKKLEIHEKTTAVVGKCGSCKWFSQRATAYDGDGYCQRYTPDKWRETCVPNFCGEYESKWL